MADIAELALKVETRDLNKANSDMDKFGKTAKKTGDTTAASMRKVEGAIKGAIAGLGIAKTIQTVIANTVAQERAIAQLEQTLRSTGRFTPELSQQMQDFASALQGVTTYGDEAVIASQALLLTFTRVGGEAFGRAQQAILDVATAMGQDLQSATLQVGKALNDPVLGMTALSRSGIQFTESQKEVVKQLVETGREAEAQAIILAELETQFGGSAAAAKNTLGGALQSLKNAFGDLLEGDSGGEGVKGATEAINELTELLNAPATKQGFATVTGAVLSLTQAAAEGIVKFSEFGTAIGETLARLSAGADTPIARINDELDDANARLAFLGQELNRTRLLRTNPFASTAELEAEWTTISNRIKELEQLRDQFNADPIVPVVANAPAATAPNVPVAPGVSSGISDELKKQQEEIAKTIAKYQEQADTLGMTATELELYKLQVAGASDEQVRQAATLLQLVDAYKMQEQAMADVEARREEARAALGTLDPIAGEQQNFEKQLEDLRLLNEMKLIEDARYLELKMQLEMEHAEQMKVLEEERFRSLSEGNELLFASLDQLQAKGGEVLVGLATGATNGEEAMRSLGQAILNEAVNGLVQMGIEQVKNFIMGQTQQAAATASGVASGATLAAAYAPAAAAASVATVGAAPVAGLTSLATTIPAMLALFAATSFDGGGFTGFGPRAGGVDGKGGFPALLHPNETVIDHTKGQGMGGTVVNIHNAPSDTTTKRGTDANGNEVVDVFLADMRSDGPMSRQMKQTFGVQRRGG